MATRDLGGKIALGTGAASGIGRATALALARAGADLWLCDIDEPRLGDRRELAGLRDAIAVVVAPHEQLGPGRVALVDDAVAVAVQLRQRLEAVAREPAAGEGRRRAEELRPARDRAVGVAVEGEPRRRGGGPVRARRPEARVEQEAMLRGGEDHRLAVEREDERRVARPDPALGVGAGERLVPVVVRIGQRRFTAAMRLDPLLEEVVPDVRIRVVSAVAPRPELLGRAAVLVVLGGAVIAVAHVAVAGVALGLFARNDAAVVDQAVAVLVEAVVADLRLGDALLAGAAVGRAGRAVLAAGRIADRVAAFAALAAIHLAARAVFGLAADGVAADRARTAIGGAARAALAGRVARAVAAGAAVAVAPAAGAGLTLVAFRVAADRRRSASVARRRRHRVEGSRRGVVAGVPGLLCAARQRDRGDDAGGDSPTMRCPHGVLQSRSDASRFRAGRIVRTKPRMLATSPAAS